MKSLVSHVSVEHGNTEKGARAISEVLSADLKEAKNVNLSTIQSYELIDFGSRFFMGKFHARLLKLASEMPPRQSKAFIVSIDGYGKRLNIISKLGRCWKAKDTASWEILPVRVGTLTVPLNKLEE